MMMRKLPGLVVGMGIIGHLAALAQAPPSRGGNAPPDVSGIYMGEEGYARPDVYPLTEEGERVQRAHDPYAGDPSQYDCEQETMPRILLWGAGFMELTREDGRIIMHVERGDTVRSIHIDDAGPPGDQAHTALGYSVGRWADGVLTVETTHVTGGVLFAEEGYPVSRDARMTERYWRNPGARDLQMELVIEDPVYYTEPVMLKRVWVWSPEERVHPYNCVSLELDESDPVDIEELKRRLEQL